MQLILYTANCSGNAENCIYPNKSILSNEEDVARAVARDHVFAKYKGNYRSKDNFLESCVIPMDCDNDHSENPKEWETAESLSEKFKDVEHIIIPSRHHMQKKGNLSARPRLHVLFPTRAYTDHEEYAKVKSEIQSRYSFFDDNAVDAARFFFGSKVNKEDVLWNDGFLQIDEILDEEPKKKTPPKAAVPKGIIQEGNRNNAMSHFAGRVLKKYGITDKAYQLFMEQSEKCIPPLPDDELKKIWNSATGFAKKIQSQEGYVPPEEYNKEPEWEAPIPFDEYNLPQFPVETLPKAIKDYVEDLSESTQTPVDMAATSAIAVLSVCMQGKFKIMAKADWIEPVNLFVLDVMNPSERKSAVENAMVKPINTFETERNMQNAAAIESSKMQKRILERRQKSLEDQAAKGKADKEDVERIAEEIANYREMKPMKLYVDDITTEKLTSVLAGNDGRAAILSTEGGIFDTLAGAYSKTVNIDVMLKGYSGDSIRVDRIGRNSESIMNPSLTVLLMVQPSVLAGIMQNGTFRGRGLTARFLYCIPASYVGKRKYRTKSVPDEVYREYERCIRNLLEDECEKEAELITLSKEADALIEKFAERLEPELKRGYADIVDWAGKLVGNIQRIAALLCRASVRRSHDFLDSQEPLVVSGATMRNAIKIGEYFIEHAKAAFMLMGADPIISQCKKVVDILVENGLIEFNRRDIMRLCRNFKKAEDAQQVLTRLVDYGYIAVKSDESYSGKGRPPVPTYLVNPKLYE